MNCFNHNSEIAVSQCQDCSSGLCPECSIEFSIPICRNCNDKRSKTEKGSIIKELILTFVIGGIITKKYFEENNVNFNDDIGFSIFMFYIFSGIVAGWHTLSRITPSIFISLPIVGWIIYFIFKLILSLMIGPFILPFRLIMNLRRLMI